MIPVMLTVVWMTVLGLGFARLWKYESTPGEPAIGPRLWPQHSLLQPSNQLPTLLMFAHPKCPCTQASIAELHRLMTCCQGLVDVRVLFFKPAGSDANWARTGLWMQAESIPGVRVLVDHDGNEARQFGATTSGHSFLFDVSGELMFDGGITISRGHEGQSVGKRAIESLLQGHGARSSSSAFVFGCSLREPDQPQVGFQ